MKECKDGNSKDRNSESLEDYLSIPTIEINGNLYRRVW